MRKAETAALLVAMVVAAGAARAGEGFAIVGARVFTGVSPTEQREDWTVVVAEGRVAALGPRDAVPIPDGVRVVDGRGRTILPGLVDLHVHLFGAAARYDRPVDVDPAVNADAAAAFGVTTQLDLNAPEDRLFARFTRARSLRPGAPRVLFAGAAISAPGGHGTEGGFPGRVAADGDEARRHVRELAERGVHVVKVVADGGGWADLPTVPALSDETLRAVVEAAHAAGKKVVVHAIEVERARVAVEAGADALAHLPLVGALDDAFVAAVVERNTAILPTLAGYEAQFGLAADPARLEGADVRRFVPEAVREGFLEQRWLEETAASARAAWFWERWPDALTRLLRLHEAGARLLPGTDAGIPGVFHGDALHRELAAWNEAGVPAGACLFAATRRAARFLGLDDRIGGIAVGLEADLLVVDGDPLADLSAARRVVFVVVAGKLVERDTLSRRVSEAEEIPPDRRLVLADFEGETEPAFDVRRSVNAAEDEARGRRLADGGPRNATSFLRVEGDVRFRAPSGGYAGVRIPVAPAVAAECATFTGVRFRARAAERRTVRLLVVTDAVEDGDAHGAKCVVGAEWHAYHIPFDALRQVGHGRRVRFEPTRITGIEILTEAGDDGPFRIDLDDVELYR